MLAIIMHTHLSSTHGISIQRQGFTLIELLVTIGVLVMLMGMLYPAVMMIQRSSDRNATRSLVQAIALAIEGYQVKAITVTLPTGPQVRRMWNVDQSTGDHFLDDDASTPAYVNDAGQTENAALRTLHAANGLPSWYTGLAGMSPINIPDWAYDRTTGRIMDRWGQTLRITLAADIYGVEGVGIWSAGMDGKTGKPDEAAARDDICSWRGSKTGQQD